MSRDSSEKPKAPSARPRQSRLRTAIHEAAHAVIGRVLGQLCGQATIVTNAQENEAGHAITADPWATMSEWDSAGRWRDKATIMRGRIMGFMAGAEAVEVLCGGGAVGDGDDRYRIALMLDSLCDDDGEAARWEQRLRRHTRALVRRHADKIELVAKMLMSRRTLSGAEIDALIDPTALSRARAERDALIRQVLAAQPDLSEERARFAVKVHLHKLRASS